MTENQFKVANKKAFYILTVLQIAQLLTMIYNIVFFAATPALIAASVVIVLGFVGLTVGHIKYGDTIIGEKILLGSSTISYVVSLLAVNKLWFYSAGLAVVIVSIMYLDSRIVIEGMTLLSITLLIEIIRLGSAGVAEVGEIIVYIGVDIICFYSSVAVIRLLVSFNDDNLNSISDAARKQAAVGMEMTTVANKINELFVEATELTRDLDDIINKSNEGMTNIADSTEQTAQSVTDQAAKLQEIKAQTDTTSAKSSEMMEASSVAQTTVEEGIKAINNLKEKSEAVTMASDITEQSTQAVMNKVEEVQSIVGSIMAISKQTNLLALNASIEAARAGEAGKGFAVVADEIRQLSEQTNGASNQITQIIRELTDDATKSMESIQQTVASIQEQNEKIEIAEQNFHSIGENVGVLIGNAREIGDGMEAITEATSEINDSISTLSATSEEVAALSGDGQQSSKNALEKFDELHKVLSQMKKESARLAELNI